MSRNDDFGSPPPELKLKEDWPGLNPEAEFYVDHNAVRTAARDLRKELTFLKGDTPSGGVSAAQTGTGTANDVQVVANVGGAQTGTWETADYFGQNVAKGYEVLYGRYTQLIDRIEKMSTALEKVVGNTDKGETASGA